jgi:predicted metal-dependent HD superfamily phosphohydrolase
MAKHYRRAQEYGAVLPAQSDPTPGQASGQTMVENRFVALWNRCFADSEGERPTTIYADLVRRYSEPHRCYHTCDHITHCLKQFDLAADLMDNSDAVEMGLWFHDVICEPGAADNELKSAQLFEKITDDQPSSLKQSVYDLIMVTKHPEKPKCLDEKFMVDIDLSSFGLPWGAFMRDSQAVREEFAHAPDESFFAGHLKFLNSLIGRPTFFFTDFFQTRYEAIARDNIARYMKDLHAKGYS